MGFCGLEGDLLRNLDVSERRVKRYNDSLISSLFTVRSSPASASTLVFLVFVLLLVDHRRLVGRVVRLSLQTRYFYRGDRGGGSVDHGSLHLWRRRSPARPQFSGTRVIRVELNCDL